MNVIKSTLLSRRYLLLLNGVFPIDAALEYFLCISYGNFCFTGDLPLKSSGLLSLVASTSANNVLNFPQQIYRHPVCLIPVHIRSPDCRIPETKACGKFPGKLGLAAFQSLTAGIISIHRTWTVWLVGKAEVFRKPSRQQVEASYFSGRFHDHRYGSVRMTAQVCACRSTNAPSLQRGRSIAVKAMRGNHR